MLNIRQAVIVEGKYDKIKLSSVVRGVILCTDGFRIFKDRDKMRIIRHYADTTGIIILTDSDSAGFKIRSYLKGSIGGDKITNVYIPDIFGKERRKSAPSKEGKLGVEGMDEKTLTEAFIRAGIIPSGIMPSEQPVKTGGIDKMLLYELGFSGTPDASARRKKLLSHLGLPELMTTNALADILDTMLSDEELKKLTGELFNDKNPIERKI